MGWLLLLKAWWDVVTKHDLVRRYSSRAGSSLYFQLIWFGGAHFIIFGHVFCWLRHIIWHLFTLLAVSPVVLLLLLRFGTHLWALGIVPSWRCCYICLLLRCSWLICCVLSVTQHFRVILVFILVELILISINIYILFFLTFLIRSVHFAQVVYRIPARVSLIWLGWSYILMDEILLLLNVACWLRSLLSSATRGWHNIAWLWSTALALIL